MEISFFNRRANKKKKRAVGKLKKPRSMRQKSSGFDELIQAVIPSAYMKVALDTLVSDVLGPHFRDSFRTGGITRCAEQQQQHRIKSKRSHIMHHDILNSDAGLYNELSAVTAAPPLPNDKISEHLRQMFQHLITVHEKDCLQACADMDGYLMAFFHRCQDRPLMAEEQQQCHGQSGKQMLVATSKNDVHSAAATESKVTESVSWLCQKQNQICIRKAVLRLQQAFSLYAAIVEFMQSPSKLLSPSSHTSSARKQSDNISVSETNTTENSVQSKRCSVSPPPSPPQSKKNRDGSLPTAEIQQVKLGDRDAALLSLRRTPLNYCHQLANQIEGLLDIFTTSPTTSVFSSSCAGDATQPNTFVNNYFSASQDTSVLPAPLEVLQSCVALFRDGVRRLLMSSFEEFCGVTINDAENIEKCSNTSTPEDGAVADGEVSRGARDQAQKSKTGEDTSDDALSLLLLDSGHRLWKELFPFLYDPDSVQTTAPQETEHTSLSCAASSAVEQQEHASKGQNDDTPNRIAPLTVNKDQVTSQNQQLVCAHESAQHALVAQGSSVEPDHNDADQTAAGNIEQQQDNSVGEVTLLLAELEHNEAKERQQHQAKRRVLFADEVIEVRGTNQKNEGKMKVTEAPNEPQMHSSDKEANFEGEGIQAEGKAPVFFRFTPVLDVMFTSKPENNENDSEVTNLPWWLNLHWPQQKIQHEAARTTVDSNAVNTSEHVAAQKKDQQIAHKQKKSYDAVPLLSDDGEDVEIINDGSSADFETLEKIFPDLAAEHRQKTVADVLAHKKNGNRRTPQKRLREEKMMSGTLY